MRASPDTSTNMGTLRPSSIGFSQMLDDLNRSFKYPIDVNTIGMTKLM